MKRKIIIPIIGLAIYLVATMATAAQINFDMGSNYGNGMQIKYLQANGNWKTEWDAGGNFGSFKGRRGESKGAMLGIKKLDFAYCIDLFHSVSLNGNYTANVSYDGFIPDRGKINNAEKIAWLITKKAKTATTLKKQAGLQAAIWKLVHGDKFELLDNGSIRESYDYYLSSIGSNIGDVSRVAWIDPYSGENLSRSNQDIVGFATPIPATIWLFGSAIIGFVGSKRLKNKVIRNNGSESMPAN